MKHTKYKTQGVCAKEIDIETENGKIENVEFLGGCNGNLKAISRLVKGKDIQEIIDTLEGNTCGNRKTSCTDQLAQALKEIQQKENQK